MDEILGFTTRLARQAGELLLDQYRSGEWDARLKADRSVVTTADVAADTLISTAIQARFPGEMLLSEELRPEALQDEQRLTGPLWVVDPLDGTTNFAHGYPVFCVSIGLLHEGKPVVGVVYDPVREELFEAARGAGATLNGRPIRVSDCPALGEALLVTGFPYDFQRVRDNTVDLFSRFLLRAQAVRRDGSAALDLCYVAAGRFDGFWERRLKPWDTAGATVILREAGGLVTRFDGAPFSVFDPEILAAGPNLHSAMISVFQGR